MRKYHGCSYAIDRPIDGVESYFSYFPLLYHDYRPVSEFRDHGIKVLSKNNISLSSEDTKHKETYMPSYEQRSQGSPINQVSRTREGEGNEL